MRCQSVEEYGIKKSTGAEKQVAAAGDDDDDDDFDMFGDDDDAEVTKKQLEELKQKKLVIHSNLELPLGTRVNCKTFLGLKRQRKDKKRNRNCRNLQLSWK